MILKYESCTEGILKIQEVTVILKMFSFLIAEALKLLSRELTFALPVVSATYSILKNLGTRRK